MPPAAGVPGELDGTPTRLHGEAARQPRQLVEHAPTRVVARTRTPTGPLDVVRSVRLEDTDLVVHTAFTNAGDTRVSYLYGEHPCFALTTFAGGRISIGVDEAWVPGPPLAPASAKLDPGPIAWPRANSRSVAAPIDCSVQRPYPMAATITCA